MKNHIKYGLIKSSLMSLSDYSYEELDFTQDEIKLMEKLKSLNLNDILVTDYDTSIYVSIENMEISEVCNFFEFIIKSKPSQFHKTSENHYLIWY